MNVVQIKQLIHVNMQIASSKRKLNKACQKRKAEEATIKAINRLDILYKQKAVYMMNFHDGKHKD
jgi:hypothetical protein